MEKEVSSQRREEIYETAREMVQEGEDLYERKEFKEEALPLIIFRLSREWYGVEMTKVKEILKRPKITPLPSSPEYIVGIINLRGEILSVTDLKAIFNLPGDEPTESTRIIAIGSGFLETGLLVDEVVESIEVPANKIEPGPFCLPAGREKYIEGLFKWENKLVAFISVERILEKGI